MTFASPTRRRLSDICSNTRREQSGKRHSSPSKIAVRKAIVAYKRGVYDDAVWRGIRNDVKRHHESMELRDVASLLRIFSRREDGTKMLDLFAPRVRRELTHFSPDSLVIILKAFIRHDLKDNETVSPLVETLLERAPSLTPPFTVDLLLSLSDYIGDQPSAVKAVVEAVHPLTQSFLEQPSCLSQLPAHNNVMLLAAVGRLMLIAPIQQRSGDPPPVYASLTDLLVAQLALDPDPVQHGSFFYTCLICRGLMDMFRAVVGRRGSKEDLPFQPSTVEHLQQFGQWTEDSLVRWLDAPPPSPREGNKSTAAVLREQHGSPLSSTDLLAGLEVLVKSACVRRRLTGDSRHEREEEALLKERIDVGVANVWRRMRCDARRFHPQLRARADRLTRRMKELD
ncbi:unnamed protein product [Vitrella brassicaformis CCMP3155]|uniref:Uncharacterized protein n=1 Tax=Vitrella brassicaformis (strain CCMP3155) TaxID=1169540 RepID=A0A0G4GAP4_VITBC|nr:unnamed protein product [Vitrella brassicaformis CCMP3155]|eukprot:CEM25865.1 unnamed protein product [Vitrella brassicaformis CCMP3155]